MLIGFAVTAKLICVFVFFFGFHMRQLRYVINRFFFCAQNIDCGYTLELPWWLTVQTSALGLCCGGLLVSVSGSGSRGAGSKPIGTELCP